MDDDPEQIITLLQTVTNQSFDSSLVFAVLSILLLLISSALISGSEVAFFSLDSSKLADKDKESVSQIKKLMQKPNHLLATILISNNFINVAIVILSTFITNRLFDFANYPILSFIIQVVIVTFALLLLGEVIPKVYANQNTLDFAKMMSTPLTVLSNIFKPLSQLLVSSTSIIEKRFRSKGYKISVDDLSSALDLAGENDTKEEEKRILRSIVEFGNIQVKEIMKSRVDVTAIEQNTDFSEVRKTVISCGYSRIPVFKENFDTILGILYIKDLLPFLEKETFDWVKLIRTPFFVPEGKMIDDLMKEFQEKKTHLAVVVDEYGGTSGIVTLEDIIEEIVGDINDEFDDDGIQFSKLDNTNFIFEGKTSLNDVLKTIDGEIDFFDDIKGESDTLAGLILEMKGDIPKHEERLVFKQYTFTVESVDKTRVNVLKLLLMNRFILICIALTVFACNESYTPKPSGYPRIDFPEKSTFLAQSHCPFSFEQPVYTSLNFHDENKFWFDLKFESLSGTLHMSYKPLNNDLYNFTEDSRDLAYKHAQKAEAISEQQFINDSLGVYGTVYSFQGNTATPLQFFLTDSANHFVRGALYFNTAVNDSIIPISNFIKDDIYAIIESWKWE